MASELPFSFRPDGSYLHEIGRAMANYHDALARCYSLARAHLGFTAPNPNVAAVILNADGEIISEGAHNRTISPDHAEVVAIKNCTENLAGATMVVSLEPCNHVGTTPACVDAIIAAKIAKVIYAVADPNPIAAGGAQRLRSAGVVVEQIESTELEFIQRAWLHKVKSGLPLITLKVASTADGRIAAADFTSQWISSPQSRDDVQVLRSQVDAIVVGTGTVIADNPTLRPRIEGARNPVRIVVGQREIPAAANVNDGLSRTHFIRSRDVEDLRRYLVEEKFNHVLVEAGPVLATAMLRAGMVHEIINYQAPKLLGSGPLWVDELGISTLEAAQKLELISTEVIAGDVKIHWKVVN